MYCSELKMELLKKLTRLTNYSSIYSRKNKYTYQHSACQEYTYSCYYYIPSESVLFSAIGGMIDTLHWPSGHTGWYKSLQAVCT